CFVMGGDGPGPREIVVGMSNDRMVEIKEGLKVGEQVVLNPKRLVGDGVKTRKSGGENGNGNGGNGSSKPAGTAPARDRGPAAGGPGMPPGPGGALGGPGGPPADGRPQAGPGAPAGPGGPGGQQMSAEERQKRQQEMLDRFKKASPEERKQMLEQIPESFRD